MDRTHWFILPLAMAAMWLAFCLANRPQQLQQPVPVVQPDVWGDIRKEVQRMPWTNPMQPRDSAMPGGLK